MPTTAANVMAMNARLATSSSSVRACVVCEASDVRMLIAVPLSNGTMVTLCGSHALMYRRGGEQAASIDELAAKLGDRRESEDRRACASRALGEKDDLGAQLTEAFAGERRQQLSDRRAG